MTSGHGGPQKAIDGECSVSAPTYELTKVETPSDWAAYHAIRREVLFEARGKWDYDPEFPDDRKPENLPLLLKADGAALGTVRLDMRPGRIAIVRLVAIKTEHQRHGHAAALLHRMEDTARSLDVAELRVFAAAEAAEFYRRKGFEMPYSTPIIAGAALSCGSFCNWLRCR